MDKLKCVVTGVPHSGTTLINELMQKHPQLQSGYECGFMLFEKSALTLDHYMMYMDGHLYNNTKISWGLSDIDLMYIFLGDTWNDIYNTLVDRSAHIDKDKFIFDKDPRYLLAEQIQKVLKETDVPIIVNMKHPASIWYSWKRRNMPIDVYIDEYNRCCKHLLEVESNSRVKIVYNEDIEHDVYGFMNDIFSFIGLPHISKSIKLVDFTHKRCHLQVSSDSVDPKCFHYIDKIPKDEIDYIYKKCITTKYIRN